MEIPASNSRSHGEPAGGALRAMLVGVVGSGNLEVLLEPRSAAPTARCDRHTSARGFGAIWQAVLERLHRARHPLAGLRVSINDMGATPAVGEPAARPGARGMTNDIVRRAPSISYCRVLGARAHRAACSTPAASRMAAAAGAARTSPHLAQLGLPGASTTASSSAARSRRHEVLCRRAGRAFMGGGVGEVHGAKLVGLLRARAGVEAGPRRAAARIGRRAAARSQCRR